MDVDNRGIVNVTDLLALLAAWGSCLPPARPTSTVMAVQRHQPAGPPRGVGSVPMSPLT